MGSFDGMALDPSTDTFKHVLKDDAHLGPSFSKFCPDVHPGMSAYMLDRQEGCREVLMGEVMSSVSVGVFLPYTFGARRERVGAGAIALANGKYCPCVDVRVNDV